MKPETNHSQIKLIRKYLKLKILEDNITFRGHDLERTHVYELMRKTVSNGESNSALILGPRGSGKTTLINSVINQLSKELDLERDAFIIKLNGLLHHDDKIALKAITAQMKLENAVGDRVFGTFAENLAFLLNCLQSGSDRRCKSMIFVLDEFDLFCHSGKSQTLLYNLFDIAHSGQSPICVLGITSRLDVMELLEKRVKSRFSHRHILIFPNEITNETDYQISNFSPLENYKKLLVELLSIPLQTKKAKTKRSGKNKNEIQDGRSKNVNKQNGVLPNEVIERCNVDSEEFSNLEQDFVIDWNSHVGSLIEDEKIVDALEKLCYYTIDEQIFRNVLFQVTSKLSATKPYIDNKSLEMAVDAAVATDHVIEQLQSLSVLELSLVIAMKHALDIFDGQPMNFEMVLHRYTKFANSNSTSQTVPRPVILKAFEHLQALEIITPVKTEGIDSSSRVQKEYQLYTLSVARSDIEEAVKKYKNLPTEIMHWLNNSIE